MEGVTGAVRVIEAVAPKWRELADCLGLNPSKIAVVGADYPLDCEGACRMILELWLRGDRGTREPVSWSTLIQALRETSPTFEPLANELTDILVHM